MSTAMYRKTNEQLQEHEEIFLLKLSLWY